MQNPCKVIDGLEMEVGDGMKSAVESRSEPERPWLLQIDGCLRLVMNAVEVRCAAVNERRACSSYGYFC
jgi:hypothetical protein